MPEAIELPGIDSAPATPSPSSSGDTGAPSETTDNTAASPPAADRDESRDTSTPADPADATKTDDNDASAPAKSRRGAQRRFDELTAEKREASERANRAEQLLHQVVTGLMSRGQGQSQAAAEGIGDTPEPKKADFADALDYMSAKASYDAEQRLLKRLGLRDQEAQTQREQHATRQRQAEFAQATERLHTVFGAQMHEAEAQYPDFREVISSAPYEVPLRVEAAAVSTGAGGLVAYYLAQYPHVMGQLDNLPDMLLGQQVSRIVAHMRSTAASQSTAPAPGRPVSGRGGGPVDYPANATPEQHLAWMNRGRTPKDKRT